MMFRKCSISIVCFLYAFTAFAQTHNHGQAQQPGMAAPMHQSQMMYGEKSSSVAEQPGQAAFAAIQEIVEIVEADPKTDWAKVKSFTSERGSLYVAEELTEPMRTGLKEAQDRPAWLINPVWTAQLQNQELHETKFSNFEDTVRAVNAYDQQDRRAIVLMVRGFIVENLDRTLANALRTPGNDQAWALRTVRISDASMMKLANETGWPELGKYYETEVENLAAYANGKISRESYLLASKKNQAPLSAAIKGYQTDAFHVRMLKHKPLADSIGSYVVGTSKLAAQKSMTKQ